MIELHRHTGQSGLPLPSVDVHGHGGVRANGNERRVVALSVVAGGSGAGHQQRRQDRRADVISGSSASWSGTLVQADTNNQASASLEVTCGA